MNGGDINLIRGIVLIVLILAFFGLCAWAWHRNRKPEFTAASLLPLEEDDGTIPVPPQSNEQAGVSKENRPT